MKVQFIFTRSFDLRKTARLDCDLPFSPTVGMIFRFNYVRSGAAGAFDFHVVQVLYNFQAGLTVHIEHGRGDEITDANFAEMDASNARLPEPERPSRWVLVG